jgi:uncharacterized protein
VIFAWYLQYCFVPFEFDPNKSVANHARHGIDFYEAQKLWLDPKAIIEPAKNIKGEERFRLTTYHRGVFWSAIYTIRENNIPIISVRRAREDEKERYENYNG